MRRSNQPISSECKALTVANFAKLYNVHVASIYRWLDQGHLKSVRIGGRRLVLLDSVPPPEEPKGTGTLLDAG